MHSADSRSAHVPRSVFASVASLPLIRPGSSHDARTPYDAAEARAGEAAIQRAVFEAQQLDFGIRAKAFGADQPSRAEIARAAFAKTHANYLAIDHRVSGRAAVDRSDGAPTAHDRALIHDALEYRCEALHLLEEIGLLRTRTDAALRRGVRFGSGTPERTAAARAAESLIDAMIEKRSRFNDRMHLADELEHIVRGKVVGV